MLHNGAFDNGHHANGDAHCLPLEGDERSVTHSFRQRVGGVSGRFGGDLAFPEDTDQFHDESVDLQNSGKDSSRPYDVPSNVSTICNDDNNTVLTVESSSGADPPESFSSFSTTKRIIGAVRSGIAKRLPRPKNPSSQKKPALESRKLGTINGVFLPCLQTILGVILFLRLTTITAQAGCFYATLIILICVTSTFLTALSLSALATNGTVRAGGPYYVISRTLGVEIGGALGLLFYFGTTMASGMYVLGAIEAICHVMITEVGEESMYYNMQMASLLLMLFIASVVLVGVKYVNMASNLFLGLLFLSLFCMCLGCILFAAGVYDGALSDIDRIPFDNLWPRYTEDPMTGVTPTFFSLVALFYPSVTGILAGSSRSALLADPAKAIPRGTLSAIGTTTLIYVFVVWLFGLTISNTTLMENKFVVASVSFPQEQVVRVGVLVSSVGAAMQCLAGAPRLLEAIAMDDTMPFLRVIKPRKPGTNTLSTPKRALWITWILASLPTLAGNLDRITPIVTIFFLLMYSGINLSCFILGILKTPGFRPTFKYFHWSISLLGFVWCLGLALVISWYMALLSMAMFFALYVYNKRQKATKNWGDVGDPIRYNIVTALLRHLTGTTTEHVHAKNWRPQLVTFIDTDEYGHPTNLHVLSLAAQLNHGQGINMVVSIMERSTDSGSLEERENCEVIEHSKSLLQQHIKREAMHAFAEVAVTTNSVSEAIWSAVIHSGLGPLSPNTVMLPFPDRRQRSKRKPCEETFVTTLRGLANLNKAMMLFRGTDVYPTRHDIVEDGCIDVWWVVHDGGLLLLLPYILSKNSVWGQRGAKLRLFAVSTSATENPERLREAVTHHLQLVRISAQVIVVDLTETTIADDMREAARIESGVVTTEGILSNDINTHHHTVGEVFSNQAYEVPYSAMLPDDLELAESSGTPDNASQYDRKSPTNSVLHDETLTINDNALDNDIYTQRMNNAGAFNRLLNFHSGQANLVITNMPLIRPNQPASDFFDYVDTMCERMDNVVLIRGSGAEVITTYA